MCQQNLLFRHAANTFANSRAREIHFFFLSMVANFKGNTHTHKHNIENWMDNGTKVRMTDWSTVLIRRFHFSPKNRQRLQSLAVSLSLIQRLNVGRSFFIPYYTWFEIELIRRDNHSKHKHDLVHSLNSLKKTGKKRNTVAFYWWKKEAKKGLSKHLFISNYSQISMWSQSKFIYYLDILISAHQRLEQCLCGGGEGGGGGQGGEGKNNHCTT